MKGTRPATPFLLCWLMATGIAAAQTVDLQSGQGRRTIDGHVAGARAGSRLHVGDLTGDYWTKELIVGVPDDASGRGTVRIYIGIQRVLTDTTTANSDVIVTGGAAGDRFGAAFDAGYVTQPEVQLVNGSPVGALRPRDLIVGAPDAQNGRGAVYVFAGPFVKNTSRTTANAVRQIIGAPGDHLGSNIETADLNGDGYREVILPVDARGIVYVVDVHNAPAGTIDLEVSVPGTILTGLVAPISVAAGDMTGDGIVDLAVGTPSAQLSRGLVYLFVSRARVLPPSIAAPTGADAQLAGEEAGDRFGASMWVADIDDDSEFAADLLVGAPGADGPANSRADAGAVYVVWGRAADLATNFRTGLVLHGAAAGHRLGTVVTAGNVTRRTPQDVVMLAPGANGGAGEVYLYYGRHVFEFPSSKNADLATSASRRIVSDEAAGPISAVRAWEATGEGAEEIVVGVPDASTTAGAAAGRIYIAISPRLELSLSTATMRATQCAPGFQDIEIHNPSVIAVPWQLYDAPSWVEIQPATGTVALGAPATVRLIARTGTLAPGTYSQRVEVRSIGPDLGHAVPVTIQLTVDASAPLRRTANEDFNGDGCADPAVFNRLTATWRVPGRPDQQLGASGDRPVPGDYNGDGIAELAVFRPSTATWILEDGTTIQHGSSGDIPVPADYDGDGHLDIAVFSPRTAMWSVRGQSPVQFGAVGDIPVPADYNGDGHAEFAVYRRSMGEWLIQGSPTVTWGSLAELPVPADYDGDGRTDIAVYARSTSTWRVFGQFTAVWGQPSDIPVPLDTDRNGRAELVTFRRSTGAWLSYDRTTGISTTTTFGGAGAGPAREPAFMRLFTGSLDFEGDGRGDITIWRPSTGFWYTKKSGTDYKQWFSMRWGDPSQGDQLVPADYDGDGATDIAVWRESTGTWFVKTSGSNFTQWFMMRWGQAGDRPMPGDYDGDGRADIAIWRPSDGVWYIKRSTTATWFSFRWGVSSDVPVPADYDGDGTTDIAVWRPGTGVWYVKTSSSDFASYFTVQWGDGPADIPMAADFDGDGQADVAFWRPETGVWHVKTSGSAYATSFSKRWGAQSLGDAPIAADFDGDGRTDITVWRPSTGEWFVLTSGSEYRTYFSARWGLGALGDRPIGRKSR